ncbi:MAG TPA: LysE family transporter [Candidatus Eisenbacteria bacterium]|nr:LysE family transporter [Candidatus Eisenbacteria bacterium]
MDPSLFFRGAVLGFCIAAPVGPIGILCIRRTLAESRASGFASGLGAATADALYGVVAAFGITIVSDALMKGRLWFAVAGGLFLSWLGWRTLSARPPEMAPVGSPATGPRPSLWGAWGSTFLLTITNPMTILSFAAVFAGLGLGSIKTGPESAASLVAGVFLGSAAWWLALSGAVSMVRSRFSPASLVWVNRISGAILIAFGAAALLVGGASAGAF